MIFQSTGIFKSGPTHRAENFDDLINRTRKEDQNYRC